MLCYFRKGFQDREGWNSAIEWMDSVSDMESGHSV